MTAAVPARPALEVADVLRAHGPAFLERHATPLSASQRRAIQELALCRTAALGGHTERCTGCGHERIAYNSCRNRHCPKCPRAARAARLQRELGTLLPVEYHHVVFTLPHHLGPLALANPRVLYALLFQAAWGTVAEVAADPHDLGATVGLLAVLHTWGQTLCHHPHLHCIVTGGGLACDVGGHLREPACWRSCRPGFFLPVRVLSRLFRGKFLAGLQAAYRAGDLVFPSALAGLAEPAAFTAWQAPLYEQEWVVYAKPPFAAPEVVLKYLARYSHGVALSNQRLVELAEDHVTFRYHDYASENLRNMNYEEHCADSYLVGKLAMDQILWNDALADGVPLFEICDNDSQGLLEAHVILTNGHDTFRPDLRIKEATNHVMFLYEAVFHPAIHAFRQGILDTAFNLFGKDSVALLWLDTSGLPESELAELGFKKIAGEALIFRHSATPTPFDERHPQGQDADLEALPEYEEWVEKKWEQFKDVAED